MDVALMYSFIRYRPEVCTAVISIYNDCVRSRYMESSRLRWSKPFFPNPMFSLLLSRLKIFMKFLDGRFFRSTQTFFSESMQSVGVRNQPPKIFNQKFSREINNENILFGKMVLTIVIYRV